MLTRTHIRAYEHVTQPLVHHLNILIQCGNICSKERPQLLFRSLVGHHNFVYVRLLVLVSEAEELVYWLNRVDDIFSVHDGSPERRAGIAGV